MKLTILEYIPENSKILEIADMIESFDSYIDDFLLEFHPKRPFTADVDIILIIVVLINKLSNM